MTADTREALHERVAGELPRLLAEIFKSQGLGLVGVEWTADDLFEAVLEEINTEETLAGAIAEFNKTRVYPVRRYARAPFRQAAE